MPESKTPTTSLRKAARASLFLRDEASTPFPLFPLTKTQDAHSLRTFAQAAARSKARSSTEKAIDVLPGVTQSPVENESRRSATPRLPRPVPVPAPAPVRQNENQIQSRKEIPSQRAASTPELLHKTDRESDMTMPRTPQTRSIAAATATDTPNTLKDTMEDNVAERTVMEIKSTSKKVHWEDELDRNASRASRPGDSRSEEKSGADTTGARTLASNYTAAVSSRRSEQPLKEQAAKNSSKPAGIDQTRKSSDIATTLTDKKTNTNLEKANTVGTLPLSGQASKPPEADDCATYASGPVSSFALYAPDGLDTNRAARASTFIPSKFGHGDVVPTDADVARGSSTKNTESAYGVGSHSVGRNSRNTNYNARASTFVPPTFGCGDGVPTDFDGVPTDANAVQEHSVRNTETAFVVGSSSVGRSCLNTNRAARASTFVPPRFGRGDGDSTADASVVRESSAKIPYTADVVGSTSIGQKDEPFLKGTDNGRGSTTTTLSPSFRNDLNSRTTHVHSAFERLNPAAQSNRDSSQGLLTYGVDGSQRKAHSRQCNEEGCTEQLSVEFDNVLISEDHMQRRCRSSSDNAAPKQTLPSPVERGVSDLSETTSGIRSAAITVEPTSQPGLHIHDSPSKDRIARSPRGNHQSNFKRPVHENSSAERESPGTTTRMSPQLSRDLDQVTNDDVARAPSATRVRPHCSQTNDDMILEKIGREEERTRAQCGENTSVDVLVERAASPLHTRAGNKYEDGRRDAVYTPKSITLEQTEKLTRELDAEKKKHHDELERERSKRRQSETDSAREIAHLRQYARSLEEEVERLKSALVDACNQRFSHGGSPKRREEENVVSLPSFSLSTAYPSDGAPLRICIEVDWDAADDTESSTSLQEEPSRWRYIMSRFCAPPKDEASSRPGRTARPSSPPAEYGRAHPLVEGITYESDDETDLTSISFEWKHGLAS